MELLEIQEAIKKGLINGYQEHLEFLGKYYGFVHKIREYLLTVNVAQSLLSLREEKGYQYKIIIEYSARNFYINSFAKYKYDDEDYFNIIHSEKDTSITKTHNQKIDIVLLKDPEDEISYGRSFCGIEIKGIDQNDGEIIDDLKRMSDAMVKTNKDFQNSIEFCFCGFIYYPDKGKKLINSDYINKITQKFQKKWKNKCDKLKNDYPSLVFTVDPFIIEKSAYDSGQKYLDDDGDFPYETGVIFGCLLTIKRN